MDRQSVLIVAKELIANKKLSTTAKLLFALLLDHRNKKTGQCNPSRKILAGELGVSIDVIKRAVGDLIEAGFIQRKRGRHSNWYEIRTFLDGANSPVQMVQIRPSALAYPLYEPYRREPTAHSRRFPPKKSIQSETLARYYA
ncbi:MAG TPA: helix-turn-helix domain-containing protein, partial [Rhizomicrobium sp.]